MISCLYVWNKVHELGNSLFLTALEPSLLISGFKVMIL